jgi:hypothetical protein
VTATDPNFTSLTQISNYDMRESTPDEGILTVSNLVIGTSFADVTGIAPAIIASTSGYTNGAITIKWNSTSSSSYSVLWSTNVSGSYVSIASGLTFGGGTGTFQDTVHTNLPTSFYRISSP